MLAHGTFEVAFHGEYREIVTDERIVTTEVFEGMPDAGAVTTATFEEKDGRTTLSLHVQHRARKTGTRTSTPVWRAACRSRWPGWSRSPGPWPDGRASPGRAARR